MVIRRLPEDFLVDERLVEEVRSGISELPGPDRRIALYRLSKRSLSTPEAVGKIAKAIGVRASEVSYAGLKDKHAVTNQHVTIGGLHGRVWETARIGRFDSDGCEAVRVGWKRETARASWIDHNRFEIVVRSLSIADAEAIRARLDGMRAACGGGGIVLPNLFGEQRFGSARHGHGFAARAMLAGDYEGALRLLIGTPARKDSGVRREFTRVLAEHWGDWATAVRMLPVCPERRAIEILAEGGEARDAFDALPSLTKSMAVEAYQSWLWNRVATRVLERKDAGGRGAVEGVEIPTFGPGLVLEGVWADAAREVLHDEGLDPERMRLPGLRRPVFGVVCRRLCVSAFDVEVSEPFADETSPERSSKPCAMRLGFCLPRGSYATVLIRMLEP